MEEFRGIEKIVDSSYPITKFRDLSGCTFGDIYVNCYAGRNKIGKICYKCTCKCGTKFIVIGESLLSGKTKSCGCSKLKVPQLLKPTHGQSKTRLYKTWKRMRQRCFNSKNPDFINYGARGITMCEEWRNLDNGFLNFKEWAYKNGYSDYYEEHRDVYISIDRINVNGNYCPENCRWADRKIQNNNTRQNHYLQIDRWVFPMSIWSDIVKIDRDIIWNRYCLYGWNEIESILTPVGEKRGTHIIIFQVPEDLEIYNKYDEWIKSGKIKPIEETIYKNVC